MITLAGYEDFIQIHHSENSRVYRARRVEDRQSVIVKFLAQEYPTSEQIRRYKQEYHLTCQIDSPGVIKAYSLEEWQRSYAIAFEDFGAISLRQVLQEQKTLPLKEFLDLAIAISESLGQIHAANIIHKDINPANIVVNPETKVVKIIDFGIATQLSRENPPLKNPNILEGTLAYISPEQTGRINRGLDYRTDFYSLGVTLYEMLTGKLPFEATDPLELVHCHIAKMPSVFGSRELANLLCSQPGITNNQQRITNNEEQILQVIANIVMKLMAKNAEERYQSAEGLKADLEICRQQLEAKGNIAPFALGQQDICDRFQIPQKLYGREAEIATLLAAFEGVAETGKIELMMVAGYSGIGKSSLVQELYKPITARRGYFIAGKFDQFQRNIPYSAIVAAFRGLIEQILGETEAQLQVWREKLLQGLGSSGQIIIDVIPEVELIIGKQPPVPALEPNEAQNRFNLVFGNFIRVFCTQDHPLALFIDDLQWADIATLQLLERLLINGQTSYLFLLGAYRDNEVMAGHPLLMTLDKIRQSHPVINQITLQPLPLKEVAYLISDTLKQPPEQVSELADLVLQKTGGNPFFVNEFLQALYRKKLIKFNRNYRSWRGEIAAIKARNFTDNVVELMVSKLQELPPITQKILSLAACWGAEFDLTLLNWITQRSPQETFQELKIALNYNLIVPCSEVDQDLLIHSYKFGHDRIQQAAYSLIPDGEKAATHYHIGQVVRQNLSSHAREEQIFNLLNQLNYGITLITDQSERDELAQLNLIACGKARNATAYQSAREYAEIGLSLLGENAWQRHYDMTLGFHNNLTDISWLCGDLDAMEKFINLVIQHSQSLLDQVHVYKIKIQAKVAQTKLKEATDIAQELLIKLGVIFPEPLTLKDTEVVTAEIAQLIGDRDIEDLLHLPMMTDGEKIATLQIANSVIPAAYFSNFLLYPLLICLSVKLSIQYGNIPESAFGYVCYSIVACNLLQQVDTGVKFAQLALKLVAKLDAKSTQPEVLNAAGLFTVHRKFHTKETLPILQESYVRALEVGQLEAAGYSAHNFCLNSFWSGQTLTSLEPQVRAYCNALAQLNQAIAANWCRIHWQSMLNLLGLAEPPYILSGEALQETEILSHLRDADDFFGLYFFCLHKLMLSYLFEEISSAQTYALEIKKYFNAVVGTVGIPALYLYDSLTALAAVSSASEKLSEVLQRVDENQSQLQQYWADYAPMNHQHKVDLVAAEKCRVLGQKTDAMELYDRAIAGAKANEYIQEEALANELAAKFYLAWGKDKIARVYMMDAHYCYGRWGATAKVKHLEANYPQLCLSATAKTANSSTLNTRMTSDSTNTTILDLATTIKSTNAISSEIVLEKLLATLMNIIVENAGAERGILILPRGQDLWVEAIKEPDSEKVSVWKFLALNQVTRLSAKIVNYVARTRETLVLSNATTEGNFTDDPYIQEYQCQSIACTPLINRGVLQGIIYLENNLTTAAFTEERLALLRTLAGQAAISLENARLYDACKRFVPDQFLSFLEKKSLLDVQLGDQVEREMTILFSDIRDFTTISEQMTPAENFAFINEYLGFMEPEIQKHGGFIDKYIGDGIMALFPNSADDAVQGSLAMLEQLKKYNLSRQARNLPPVRIGIGLHTGMLMLGIVGGMGRMDGTAIGDAVNLGSRVEGLTKSYGASLLITYETWQSLKNPREYDLRFVDKVKAKGKTKEVGLFEVFSADPPDLRDAKNATKDQFEKAIMLYYMGNISEAARLFEECLTYHAGDRAALCYRDRCLGV
jgi:predicted ATPase/class 3 adenylate cyclase/GAF domain-containing protein/tRNA A-37 threonylcarbamoyl transferase component Bud32